MLKVASLASPISQSENNITLITAKTLNQTVRNSTGESTRAALPIRLRTISMHFPDRFHRSHRDTSHTSILSFVYDHKTTPAVAIRTGRLSVKIILHRNTQGTIFLQNTRARRSVGRARAAPLLAEVAHLAAAAADHVLPGCRQTRKR